MESTKELVKQQLAETCAIDASLIRDDGRLVAYGLDSVRATDFIIAIEEEFGVIIKQAEAADLHTVQDVMDYIQRHRGSNQA